MKKILIVEDDEQVSKLYQESLTNEGFKVTIAATGGQGLTLLKTDKPDLVILDIMLPGGMNGFDVLEQMKKDIDLKNIPVLVLTNLDSERKVALEIGAADYLVKAHTAIDQVVAKVK